MVTWVWEWWSSDYPFFSVSHIIPAREFSSISVPMPIIEGSLEVKLPTIWTDEKQRWEESEKRREEKKKEDQKRESLRRKKIQVREKVPEGWKVGSLKRRVRSQLARWEMKNCTPLCREVHFQVKMYKTHQVRSTFWSWEVKKVHVIVVQSTFPSQNVQSTSASEHF